MRHPDMHAPIVPGKSIGDIALGARVSALLPALAIPFAEEADVNSCIQAPTGVVWYRSPALDFSATDGTVDALVAHGAYRGLVCGKVGLGAPLAELEAALGPLEDVGSELLLLANLPGIGFEITRAAGEAAGDSARISRIVVFRADTF